MSGPLGLKIKQEFKYTGGSRANFSGGGNATADGVKYIWGGQKRARESVLGQEQHTDPAGNYGVTYLRPVGANGKELDPAVAQKFKLKFGGREFPASHDGMFKLLDQEAYAPVIADAIEREEWLTEYASYAKAGTPVFLEVFGLDALKACRNTENKVTVLPNGREIPPEINKYNCEPDITKLFPGDSSEFTFRMAKMRMIIECWAPTPVTGSFPGWGKKKKRNGGIKDDIYLNADASPKVDDDGKRRALAEVATT